MSARVPRFPLTGDPGDFDELTLLASTIFLESEGEPEDGQLGVAYVVRNRMDQWGQTCHTTVLGRDQQAYDDGQPWEVFSAWNDDYRIRAEARLATASDLAREQAWRAAAAGYWKLLPDPTASATFYLNKPLTLKIRGGTLPSWYADANVVATIGRHTFLRG